VISFATPNYQEEIRPLLAGLRQFNIDYEVHLIPSFGSWQLANHYKANFIKEMLLKHKRPVVWLDADTEIRQYPGLFDKLEEMSQCDIAVNFFNDVQLCGGVMYFALSAIAIIDRWIEENNNHPERWESDNLHAVLGEAANGVEARLFKLPPPYCMFDLCKDQSNPVLWSRQASRIHRHE